MIQNVKVVFGFLDKSTKEFIPFSDKCKLICHRSDQSISIRIPDEETVGDER